MANRYCPKCHREMDEGQFYLSKGGERADLCKKCLTLHVDNFNPDTYVWILQKLDFPYIESQWKPLLNKAFAKKGDKMDGMSVIGTYLSKMRLVKWRNYHWADTQRIAEDLKHKTQQQQRIEKQAQDVFNLQMQKKYAAGAITQSQFRTITSSDFQEQVAPPVSAPPLIDAVGGDANAYNEKNFVPQEQLIDYTSQLTQQDKVYLAMKWGRLYKLSQLVQLERQYSQNIEAFGIQDPDTTASLILLCKNTLKMNQAIDCGDVDGYLKLSRAHDALRKSMKITAVQKKEKEQNFVDCVGLLVSYCQEKGGEIPRYVIDTPLDVVDTVINDMKGYTRSLIYEDTALAQQVQDYIKRRDIADSVKKDRDQAKNSKYGQILLNDKDHEQYFSMLQEERLKQQQIMQGGGEQS